MADNDTDHTALLDSLLGERTVDIVTTGRRTGSPRTTEIWTTVIEGQVYVCGTPNAGRAGVERQPRDWLANLLAEPDFILRLKHGVEAELSARAAPVTDPDQRRHLLSMPSTAYYRDAVSLDTAVRYSPIVSVTFRDDADWLNDAIRTAAAQRT
jgi:hypothetical protein